ncbi:MAG TPA: hypothetical protein VFF69_04470 [Phycisphaerales bacterium]|nr:hypothetical protein [Phycisphaerales bacterium]
MAERTSNNRRRPLSRRDRVRRGLAGALVCISGLGAAGCAVAGAMASSAERHGSKTHHAEFTELEGHTYAVVALVDRAVQAEYPALQPSLIQRIDQRIAENVNATGHVLGDHVTEYLANNPQWVTWPRGRLAEELNVDRIVFVEVNEFRTNEAGNEYVWDGLGWATVSVIERGAAASDAEVFRKDIRVRFPDDEGIGPDQVSKQGIASTLLKRLVDRASWLFYTHEEPNALTY